MKRRKSSRYLAAAILFLGSIFSSSLKAQDTAEKTENMQSPFGVLEFLHWNHDWNNYKYGKSADLKKAVALMQEAGIAWVRMDFLWNEIESCQGKFNFDKYDAIVDLLEQNKINILGILDYSVSWANANMAWNYPPLKRQDFVNYAKAVVSRYKDHIKYWEIWNEPDSAIYWSVQDGLKSYSALLKDTYTALKKIAPECKILNGGLAGGTSSVDRLYEHGAKEYFDILNLHIFLSPLHPGAVKRLGAYVRLTRKIMLRNGDSQKKIWVTEIGSPGVSRWREVPKWWLGKNPSELKQAGWVKEVYKNLLENPEVEKIFWSFLRDCDRHWGNGVDYFGLVRWNFSRKPAFFAYQEAVRRFKEKK